ncbi:MAG: hypothetical protein IJI57_13020 [Flexilinea sp.]|nr:hypothetical protein [Flexilinea sp.]
MNRENRKQKELEKKMARIWQSFQDAGKEKQALLTDHTFSFHVDDTGAGWEYVHFLLDGKSYGFRISYIGPGISEFVNVSMSLDKKESVQFTWYDEPGEYTWLFSRRDDLIYIEAPYVKNGFFLKYEYFCTEILKGWIN